MKTLDTYFKSTEASTSIFISKSSRPLQVLRPFSESLISSFQSLEITQNLQNHLKEINHQYITLKSAKTNNKIFIYNHLRHLSIRRFIQLLLDG